MKPSIDEFLKFDPKVGVDSMHISAYPRQGKSVQGNYIFMRAVGNGEMGLIPGDKFCEWRHLDNYSKYVKEIKILMPEDAEVDTIELPAKYAEDQWIRFNPQTLDIMEYLEPHKVVVIYDRCYSRIDRVRLWTDIMKQCVDRIIDHDKPIVFLDHEAGVTFPEIRQGAHWGVVEEFTELFVDFMKAYIRCIFLSQLETELCHRIRDKCIWKIYRRGIPSRRGPGRAVKKYVLRMRRDTYHIFFGELFVPLNSNPRIKEKKSIWKIIPRDLINYNGGGISSTSSDQISGQIVRNHNQIFEYIRDSEGKIIRRRKLEVVS